MDHAETSVTVYGKRAVVEALGAEGVRVERLVLARDAAPSVRREVQAAAREQGLEVEEATAARVHSITGDARNDQGVAALIALRRVRDVDAFTQSLKGAAAARPVRVMALDNITNPQNVGMIVRSVVGAGLDGLLWPQAGMPWVGGLIVKSSASSIYACPIVRCPTLVEGLWALKRAGFRLYGLEAGASADLFSLAPVHRSAFVIGGETTGISPEALELIDERIAIPMHGPIESLNAAVAASIVCFTVMRTSAKR